MNASLVTVNEFGDRPLAVTVYRRADPSIAHVATSTLERIDDLLEEGTIDSVDEVIVPSRHRSDLAGSGRIDELEQCAKRLGVTLEPALSRCQRHNHFTDTSEEVCVLPALTIVVRDHTDASILAIAPTKTEDTLLRVNDLLDAIEAAGDTAPQVEYH